MVKRLPPLAAVIALLLLASPSASCANPNVGTGPASAGSQQARELSEQSAQISELNHRVDDLNEIIQLVLLPISVLIGALAIGGVIGVVFSIRDQRRVSQLHELTVTGEIASQQRADQSFAAFFESSQKTLTLVNDTLGLAKEATDQSARTMQLKATANLERIEQRAEDLVLRIAEVGDFEELMDEAENRTIVESIDHELAALRGYLDLQDIPIPPYSRFVHGIALYLGDRTLDALDSLRRGTQDASLTELHRFSLFWTAKVNIVVGRYDQAARLVSEAREGIAQGVERYELERLAAEIDFFRAAAAHDERVAQQIRADTRARDRLPRDGSTPPARDDSPAARFSAVLGVLRTLESAAQGLEILTRTSRDKHPVHEMASLRGDILTWIGFDLSDLITQLGPPAALSASATTAFDGSYTFLGPGEDKISAELADLDGRALRSWVHDQARLVYGFYFAELDLTESADFSMAFGHAEAEYALGSERDAAEYRELERKAIEELGAGHREHRRRVEIAQVFLICKARDLKHARDRLAVRFSAKAQPDTDSKSGTTAAATVALPPEAVSEIRTEIAEVEDAYARLHDELMALRDPSVTVFSHLQRRNLEQGDFETEAKALRSQAVAYASDQGFDPKNRVPT